VTELLFSGAVITASRNLQYNVHHENLYIAACVQVGSIDGQSRTTRQGTFRRIETGYCWLLKQKKTTTENHSQLVAASDISIWIYKATIT